MDAFKLLERLIDALFYNSSKAMVSSQRKNLRRPKVWKTYVKEPCGSKFSNGICLVSLENLKNGGSFDRPSILQNNRVAIASSFGVISAILRQKFKEREKCMLGLSMP